MLILASGIGRIMPITTTWNKVDLLRDAVALTKAKSIMKWNDLTNAEQSVRGRDLIKLAQLLKFNSEVK
jgi:hypothetical protein